MPLINYAKREINFKVVYYGTGLGGKTTNIKYIHSQLAPKTRGELITLPTETDRTLFFDFLGLDLGNVKGFQTKFSLYTVPGQVEYNASRKTILKGVDGIVFVADSNVLKSAENIESLQNMIDNLAEQNISLEKIPWVLQYNKRDLQNAMPFQRMEQELNFRNVPSFEAVALEGLRVFTTLKELSKLLIDSTSS